MSNRALFEALARDHAQGLKMFLRGTLHDSSVLDEVFQQTLITAWQTIDRFDRSRSFGPWLRGIARNVIRRQWRDAARQIAIDDDRVHELVDQHYEAVHRLRNDLLDERLTRLVGCIDALPGRYRDAVRLRYRDEVKGLELAAQLQTSWDNTKKLLQRGRRMLFNCMEGKWLEVVS